MGKDGSSPWNQNKRDEILKEVSDHSLTRYFKEIMKYPVLSLREERKLARKAREGDIEARNKLILHNLRWVVNIAKQYQNRGLSLSELINEGNAGLVQAVMKYDERKKTRLTTYSNWWIRYYIVSALLNRNLIKLPSKYRRLAKKIKDGYPAITQKLGREPSLEELANELGIKPSDVSCAFNCGISELSLQKDTYEKGRGTYEEIIGDRITPSPERELVKKTLSENILRAIKRELSPKEKYVIFRHFGISFPDEMLSVSYIAKMFRKRDKYIKKILKEAIFKSIKEVTGRERKIDLRRKGWRSVLLENLEKVKKIVKKMEPLQREVFLLYTGLVSEDKPLNLREIGDILGITREASRQIKEKAISKLKRVINPEDFQTYFRGGI